MNPSKRAISMVSKCSKSPTSYNVGKIINRNAVRLFATSPGLQIDPQLTTASSETGPVPSDPKNISPTEQERKLEAQIIMSTDSRRRRAAISSSPGISFDQLPYQCFQEARLVLAEHRAEVVKQINTQRDRIARLVGQDTAISGGERQKQDRLRGMHKYLEELKIKADIHDPRVKMMFEDGLGMAFPCSEANC
jgi:large subunit ribosomal protein L35